MSLLLLLLLLLLISVGGAMAREGECNGEADIVARVDRKQTQLVLD